MSRTTNIFERKATYSFLAALSDIGGFSYVILMIAGALIAPYSAAMYAASIAAELQTTSESMNSVVAEQEKDVMELR